MARAQIASTPTQTSTSKIYLLACPPMMPKGALPVWFVLLLGHLFFTARGDVSADAPRAVLANFRVGESIAETKRSYIHFLRAGAAELYSLDAETGQIVAATKLAGVPAPAAAMCF